MSKELAKYTLDNGDSIALTDTTIRNLISTNPNVTDQEVFAFAALCKAQRLNPFTREVYLIKYGSNPASMVVGRDVYRKRASHNPNYRGMEEGITVITADNKLVRRGGALILDGEVIVGGWAKVYVKDFAVPFFAEVSFKEYAGKKKDGSLSGMWATKPGVMITKVAEATALRMAFPDDFAQLYAAEEMGVNPDDLPAANLQPAPAPEPEPAEVETVAEVAEYTETDIDF